MTSWLDCMIRALSMASAWADRVASLLYADDANALSFTQWLAKLMDYIHTWLNKWRMQGNFTKSKVMVFHPRVSAACRRRTAGTWTLGGIAIDQVSKYKHLVPGRRIMAGTRAKGACKDASSPWVLEATVVMQHRQRSDCSWFRPSSIPRSCMARKCGTRRRRSKTRCQRKESSPQHSSPASPRLLF
jgi:hypothetical protein